MSTFKIYVNNEFAHVDYSDFASMNNIRTFKDKYGKENVTIVVGELSDEEKKIMIDNVKKMIYDSIKR